MCSEFSNRKLQNFSNFISSIIFQGSSDAKFNSVSHMPKHCPTHLSNLKPIKPVETHQVLLWQQLEFIISDWLLKFKEISFKYPSNSEHLESPQKRLYKQIFLTTLKTVETGILIKTIKISPFTDKQYFMCSTCTSKIRVQHHFHQDLSLEK